MALYRNRLPQLGADLFLTDGGIETTLIFHEGLELPDFAAFHLLQSKEGRGALHKYYSSYLALATRLGTGFILESPTWRASADWGTRLGYSEESLAEANLTSIGLMEELRNELGNDRSSIVISGCLGPRGDGYVPGQTMSASEAAAYHLAQIETFADSAADMVCAITMNYVEEAAGIANAARRVGMPVAISFTVETDGKLPTGQTLQAAISEVDATTSAYPAYYMINCAHPSHFAKVLSTGDPWVMRIQGLRANASRMSHAELDEASELDSGDPVELGAEYAELKKKLPQLNVMGGCCGTDLRHIEQIASTCLPSFRSKE